MAATFNVAPRHLIFFLDYLQFFYNESLSNASTLPCLEVKSIHSSVHCGLDDIMDLSTDYSGHLFLLFLVGTNMAMSPFFSQERLNNIYGHRKKPCSSSYH